MTQRNAFDIIVTSMIVLLRQLIQLGGDGNEMLGDVHAVIVGSVWQFSSVRCDLLCEIDEIMQVNTEDVTLPWGRESDPLDRQTGHWRMAVFQDVQESIDRSKLYFLYDPIADENSGTSGPRKGEQSLVIFDLYKRCFIRELSLSGCEGTVKFLFALKCPSSFGGSSFVVASTSERYGQTALLLYRIDLTQDGFYLGSEPKPLLTNSIPLNDAFIVSMREDAPEVVLMTNPGLTIWRINCISDQPSGPVESFSVPSADLSHYYDAFLNQGSVYFLSQSPDGHFDHSRIHILDIMGQRQLRTVMCNPDPVRGAPCARKRAAIDSFAGHLLLAGGEVEYNYSVSRLIDYWVLNFSNFTWHQIPAQMPIPLIEPRLTTTNSGKFGTFHKLMFLSNVYLWGDFDEPIPGISSATHLRILRVSGFESMKPPPYNEALEKSTSLPFPSHGSHPMVTTSQAYPSLGFAQVGGDTSNMPYPQNNLQYTQSNVPYPQNQPFVPTGPTAYPQGQPLQNYSVQPSFPSGNIQHYPQQGGPSQQPFGGAPGMNQQAYYPPEQKQNCSIQ
ncbi:unnamed protein product [Thelazia callipaeda]|uniref:Protein kinase domain-containing protein n=1 Tax=Thelazia callipaeda TaxID=103827 RepID=A0A0N5D2W4_THECL|nr:unnamed protein product [Thelazia callipaeda]